MRNETSFTAPTMEMEDVVRLGFLRHAPGPEHDLWAQSFYPPSMLYMSTLCSERGMGGDHVSKHSQKTDCPVPRAQELLTRGDRCDFPPSDSMPDSRVYPPFSCRGSAGPAHPTKAISASPSLTRIVSRQVGQRGRKPLERDPRTNVTTMKSRGLCFEEACLSAAHANAARATVSTVSADCPLPCKKKSTTTGSEVFLSRRSDRE